MRVVAAFLLATLFAAAQAPNAPALAPGEVIPPPSDCSISGTVIDHVTKAPVPRAMVTVIAYPRSEISRVADNSGRWSFTGVLCVRVILAARRFGYIDSGADGEPPQPLLLNSDSPTTTTIELMPQAVITGKVVDDNGDPVTGARVVPYIARAIDGKRVMRNGAQIITDDRGVFRLAWLPPGRYTVCVEPSPGVVEYQESCYPVPLDAGAEAALRVPPGEETVVDFTLTRVHGARITGTVTGLPPGSQCTAQMARRSVAGMLSVPLGAQVSPEGKFTIDNVPPGSWFVTASVMQSHEGLFARVPVDVSPGAVENVVLPLEPVITVSGSLRTASQDDSSGSLQHVQIALGSTEPYARMGRIEWSDDHRSFTIPDVTPGNYRLVVSSPDHYLEKATLGGFDISHGEFEINAAPGPMQIVLANDGGSVDGDVILDDESPAMSGSVVLMRNGEFAGNTPIVNGHFNTGNLAPGNYAAYAWDSLRDVAYADPGWMAQYAGSGVSFSIQPGQTAQIMLTRHTAPTDY